ncbi:unnamed protein product [Mytilus edulis]|uniref:G-protein coupled receptors family 1 profile domain-containing protein n=1 Tax=Mytilus edulis TaxID=6550 RepID=A0A8S3TMZ6_MYTED|nr:unnamed protein product [Mytilus edulis]
MGSNYNLTLQWNQDYYDKLLPSVFLQGVIFLLGFIGNIIVLMVYFFRMKSNRDDRYFIPILAVFDLISGTVASVFYVLESIYFVDFPSTGLCKGLLFAMTSTSSLSALLLIAIAVQRYLKICKPLGEQMDEAKRKICLAAIMIFSIVNSCPVLLFSGNKYIEGEFNGLNVTGWTCFTGSGQYPDYEAIYYYIIFFLMVANILTISFLYIPIGLQLYRHIKLKDLRRPSMDIASTQFESISETKPSDGSTVEITRKKTMHASKINFNSMFLTIIIFYLVSYTPTCVFLIISKLNHKLWYNISTTEMIIYFILQRFYVINHVVNPLIYGYYDLKFRKEVVSLFRCS